MPYTESHWLRRFTEEADINPVFESWSAPLDGRSLSDKLRTAFSFLRRHGDRRYSAQSLMRLLTFADRLDAAALDGRGIDGADFPKVVLAEVPYTFDPETEVKSGGTVAMAVVMPDSRMMMAVNATRRGEHMGLALFSFVTTYVQRRVTVWVHRENPVGMQFCIAMDLKPWSMNRSGAVCFALTEPAEDDTDAVAFCDDYEVEQAMAEQRGDRVQPRRPREVSIDPRPTEVVAVEEQDVAEHDTDWWMRNTEAVTSAAR